MEQKPLSIQPRRNPPLSVANAEQVLRKAWIAGRSLLGEHFRKRSQERSFSTLDVDRVLRLGKIQGKPEYCPIFCNWKYRVRGQSGEQVLEVVVGLDPNEDFDQCPLIVLITGYWK